MNSREKEKFMTLKAYIGASIIIFGAITLTSGEQIPGDPCTILPTWTSVGLGIVIIFIGYLIGKNSFKKVFEKVEDPEF